MEYYLPFFVAIITMFHYYLQIYLITKDETDLVAGKILEIMFINSSLSLFLVFYFRFVFFLLFWMWNLLNYFDARVSYLRYFIFSLVLNYKFALMQQLYPTILAKGRKNSNEPTFENFYFECLSEMLKYLVTF